MKKVILTILLILFFLCSCNSTTQISESENNKNTQKSNTSNIFVYKNEYEYIVSDNKVRITKHYYNPEQKQIIIPNAIDSKSVISIDHMAFERHPGIQSITLPEGLTQLEGATFYKFLSLKEIKIPKNVTSIDSNPFWEAPSLEKITVDEDNKYFCAIDGVLYNKDITKIISYPEGKADEKYVVPDTVVDMSGDAFGYDPLFKTIVIHSNVTIFPEYNMFIFPEDIILLVKKGSAAEQYAISQQLNFQYY